MSINPRRLRDRHGSRAVRRQGDKERPVSSDQFDRGSYIGIDDRLSLTIVNLPKLHFERLAIRVAFEVGIKQRHQWSVGADADVRYASPRRSPGLRRLKVRIG